MPITEEKKQQLDHRDAEGMIQFNPRLHLVSHAEIGDAFARALESLVGGKYAVRIKSWSESTKFHLGETIEMSAVVQRCREEVDEESA
jgi:hypothetical protein